MFVYWVNLQSFNYLASSERVRK